MQLPTILGSGEKKILGGSILLLVLTSGYLLFSYVVHHQIDSPAVGGDYTEAIIGDPQLINPLYSSTNDVDGDLSSLVYSGLMKWNGVQLVPDLAESIKIDPSLKRYEFKLRKGLKFSNGESLSVKDIIFTISAIKNPAYRSPLQNTFRFVSVEQVDDDTIAFVLDKPNSAFLQHLTVGILPESLWSEILPNNIPLAALNLQPIGSGPYAFSEFTKDKKGSIRSFTFKRNTHYYGEEPKIEKITFKFYQDANAAAQALTNKNTEGSGFVSFENIPSVENNRSVKLNDSFLPRSTSLFFNPSNNLLKNTSVKLAITESIGKQSIIEDVLGGHGRAIFSPILPDSIGYDPNLSVPVFDQSKAETELETAGFVRGQDSSIRIVPNQPKKSTKKTKETETTTSDEPKTLSFKLTTIESPELLAVANEIKSQLNKVGIGIEIQSVPSSQLFSTIIEPQEYDLLLISSMSTVDSNPYLFWHSSQTGKNGLNVSHYNNKTVDSLLEKGQNTTNTKDRETIYRQFQEFLVKDMPAVFLYQSTYPFAVAKKIQMKPLETIRFPSDRFSNINSWYIKTKKTLR